MADNVVDSIQEGSPIQVNTDLPSLRTLTHFRSKVWEYFGFKQGLREFATCKLCNAEILYKAGNTSNLRSHVERKHGVTLKLAGKSEPLRLSGQLRGQIKLENLLVQKLPQRHRKSKAITKAIGAFIAMDLRPFSVVDNPGFQYFMQVSEPRYPIPSRIHIASTVIPGIYNSVNQCVVGELKKATAVSITTDSWTSRSTKNYTTVTAHTINNQWEMSSYTLETKVFNQSHTAVNLGAALEETVNAWELNRYGGPLVVCTDNASNVVKAVKEYTKFTQLPCFAHTLNLATQRGLAVKEMQRLLGRVRRIVSFFHRSTTATAILKLTQSQLGQAEHKLIQDVSTRWNSSFDMINRYLEQQAPIFATLLHKDFKKNLNDVVTLTETDNQNLENVVKILEPIKTVTTLMCSEKNATVSLIHPLKEKLLASLKGNADDNQLIADIKNAIVKGLLPRYTEPDLLQFMLLSSALPPRFKSLPYISDVERDEVFIYMSTKALNFTDLNTDLKVAVKEEPHESGVISIDSQTDGAASGTPLPALPLLPVIASPDSEDEDQQLEPPAKVPRNFKCENALGEKSEQANQPLEH